MKLYDPIIDAKGRIGKLDLGGYGVRRYRHSKCAASFLSCNEDKYGYAGVTRRIT